MTTNTVDAIVRYQKGIIVVERRKQPYGIALPGGKLESNETLEQAVEREVRQETGLKLANVQQFRTYSAPDRDPRYRSISTVFTADGYGALKAGSDAKTARVIQLDGLDSLADKFAFDHYKIVCDYTSSVRAPQPQDWLQQMVWQVYYKSSYYDNDPRMPGDVPIDERYYFVANSRQEALDKAYKLKPKLKRLKGDDEIEVAPIPLDNLAAARYSKDDGRMGWYTTEHWEEVELSSKEDAARYKLGVVLMPRGTQKQDGSKQKSYDRPFLGLD
ncbi:NUDIX hydrolase [Candidatus Woesearchaeota archaeon]|nr:NUDIX hydrolase [Candidatus Woesearchaeota archaeon]